MDKEKLIKLAEDLYQSAFDANAYYAIMMQYREMSKLRRGPPAGAGVLSPDRPYPVPQRKL